jgi:hypothetical protein
MPERRSKPKRPTDINKLAAMIVNEATGGPTPTPEKPAVDPAVSAAAAALGRLGGLKGGPARKAKLSPARRKAIAKKAAAARWRKTS